MPSQDLIICQYRTLSSTKAKKQLTSSRIKRLNVPARSKSGTTSDFAIAVVDAVTTPSTPTRVIKCCILGVRRKGVVSLEQMIAWPGANAKASVPFQRRHARLTRQYLGHVHQSSLATEVEATGRPIAQTADIGEEHDGCSL